MHNEWKTSQLELFILFLPPSLLPPSHSTNLGLAYVRFACTLILLGVVAYFDTHPPLLPSLPPSLPLFFRPPAQIWALHTVRFACTLILLGVVMEGVRYWRRSVPLLLLVGTVSYLRTMVSREGREGGREGGRYWRRSVPLLLLVGTVSYLRTMVKREGGRNRKKAASATFETASNPPSLPPSLPPSEISPSLNGKREGRGRPKKGSVTSAVAGNGLY